jgi:hypothetical protein
MLLCINASATSGSTIPSLVAAPCTAICSAWARFSCAHCCSFLLILGQLCLQTLRFSHLGLFALPRFLEGGFQVIDFFHAQIAQ